MGKRDPRIDEYIEDAAPFAKPILRHIRKVVHAGCPSVEETMKWSMPHFEHKGILCGMAAFKAHCSLGFWKGSLLGMERDGEAMGQFGRITSVRDLPSEKALIALVKRAAKLNEEGVAVPKRATKKPAGPVVVPSDLMDALRSNRRALGAFEAFSPSHRREYIEWIDEAKTEATRKKRIATTVEWVAEGKGRNWKYEPRKERSI